PDGSCTAPGYGYQFGEDFNEGEFPPTGWTVTNDVFGSNVVWIPVSQNTYNTGNFTGGTGNAADADSNAAGTAVGSYDTSLISPPISTALVGQSPVLYFRENFQVYSGNEAFDVDISTDGGNTWTTVNHQTNACGGRYTLPGCQEQLNLGSYVSGAENFQLRFRYYNLLSDFDWYVQVDDVSIGICTPVPGGLVNGGAFDYNTGTTLTGVTVTDESGNSAMTKVVGGHVGFTMFESTGDHVFTASKYNYQANVKSVPVRRGKSEFIRFAMRAGKLTSQPSQAVLNVPVNTQKNYALRIVNSGSAPVDWTLSSLNAPAPNVHAAGQTNLSLRLVQGHFSPASLPANSEEENPGTAMAQIPGTLSPIQGSSAWAAVTDYPIPVLDNCAATDEATGRVYAVGGVSNGVMTASGYAYDPTTQSWSSIASLPQPLQRPACGMVAGKLYVAGGWESNYVDNNQTLYIYDPVSDSWSEGPDDLVSIGGASSGVVLNGEFFVIGGCTSGSCASQLSAAVQVYNPATGTWSLAADYPRGIAWQGCGATKGKIYCAGGDTGGSTDTADAYVYDPEADSWSAIAPMPYDNWAMSAIATSDGHLLLQDGVTEGFGIVTNQGADYDAVTETWTDLPNNIATVYRAASACGFYIVGGTNNAFFGGVPGVELLPGSDVCSAQPVSWMSFEPASGTLGNTGRTRSILRINAVGQTPGTISRVQIVLSGNTPYDDVVIPLTVHWISGD
ncbi:MAG: choice-of-anchor J domain-containing protein, partial [Terriglobia bacterium]